MVGGVTPLVLMGIIVHLDNIIIIYGDLKHLINRLDTKGNYS